MLSATLANSPSVSTYDRSGKTLRSEPVERIDFALAQSSTTADNYKDKVTLSPNGIEKSRQEGSSAEGRSASGETEASHQPAGDEQHLPEKGAAASRLTPEEEQAVLQLKARDREVKTHEAAHLASAGRYARGGPSYSYQQGPDGQRYAVGGEVPIDLSKEKSPEATIEKMETIRRAALAPAEPSSADRSIAAAAGGIEGQARSELQADQADSGPQASGSQESKVATKSEPDRGEQPSLLRRTSLDVMA